MHCHFGWKNFPRRNSTGAAIVMLNWDQDLGMMWVLLQGGFKMFWQVTTISTQNFAPYFGPSTVAWKLCIQGRGTLQSRIAQGFELLVQCSWEFISDWRTTLSVKTNFFGNVGPSCTYYTTSFGATGRWTHRSTLRGWMRIGYGRLAKHCVWWIVVLLHHKGFSKDGY